MTPHDWMTQLWTALERPPAFALVDARTRTLACSVVHRRAWAAGGFREMSLEYPPGKLRLLLESRALPVALVLGEQLSGDICDDLSEANARGLLPRLEVAQACGVRLVSAGRPLQADLRAIPDRSGTTRVTLEASERVIFDGVDLPLVIGLDLVRADGPTRLLGLRIDSSVQEGLPAPVWYRLDGPPRGELRIDLRPGAPEDAWDVTYAQDTAHLRLFERPCGPEGRMRRLAVIFDRTTPDEQCWSLARALAVDGVPALTADRFDAPTATAAPAASEFNATLRSSLGAHLAIELQESQVEVDGWWFADTAGDGIAEPEGALLVAHEFGHLGKGSGQALSDMFAQATYSPGLDLWDPLERALEAAVTRLESCGAFPAAVLIVGNSPPNVPLERWSPIHAASRALGHPTSFRRSTGTWHRTLERCAQLGIALHYIYLEHQLCAPAEQQSHERFRRIGCAIREALAGCLPVVSARATSEGLRSGLREALSSLARRAGRPSRVEVLA